MVPRSELWLPKEIKFPRQHSKIKSEEEILSICMARYHVKLKTRYRRILWVIAVFLPGLLQAQSASDLLNQAVVYYKQGRLTQSDYFLDRSRRLAQDTQDSAAESESLLLEGYLKIAKNDIIGGITLLRQYLENGSDPFSAHVLASYYVNSGNYESARPYLEIVVASSADPQARPLLVSESGSNPNRCDLVSLEPSPEKPVFRNPDAWSQIYKRPLSQTEQLYAQYLLNVIRKKSAAEREGDTPLYTLLKSGSAAAHNRCLSIESESPDNLYRLYRNRRTSEKKAQLSYDYTFAEFLVRREKYLEALHVLRRGYQNLDPVATKAGSLEAGNPELLIRARYYRLFERIYSRLTRIKDAGTVSDLASILERYHLKVPEERDWSGLRRSLVRAAGQNLNNRESLLLLMDLNSSRADLVKKYQNELVDRDSKAENTELLFVYKTRYSY